MKIERSAAQNQLRIQKMRKINELVESLQTDAKHQMANRMKENEDEYRNLLKELLIQGLIRLIESDVTLRCREEDVSILEDVIEDAVSEYKQLMLSEVKALEGRDDIPCRVKVDQKNFLPPYNEEDPTNSCLGGFVMYCKKNRITCSQTLDDRIEMAYQQAIPQIRVTLFPSLAKQR